ncbi:hypothetical protein ACQJBY_046295 [Aegilops geniculata]
MEIIDAELRLGPPGSGDAAFGAQKKRPSSTVALAAAASEASGTDDHDAAPASKVQVVGWPPVGAYRKSTYQAASASAAKESKGAVEAGKRGGLYVKVSMDGAPYLRKVDLRAYGGYGELRAALDALFGCFSSCSGSSLDNAQFAMAYEDKDGDLMLAGDVPWDMFISSCKRLRIMRSSEAR